MQRLRAQLQNQSRPRYGSHRSRRTDGAKTRARITPKERQRSTQTQRREEERAPEKVSRGASRRRCKHGRTTSSQRRLKAQRASGCRTVVGELDVDEGSQKKKVSRGASRRMCKHECTTSSRRRSKSSVSQARVGCRRWTSVSVAPPRKGKTVKRTSPVGEARRRGVEVSIEARRMFLQVPRPTFAWQKENRSELQEREAGEWVGENPYADLGVRSFRLTWDGFAGRWACFFGCR